MRSQRTALLPTATHSISSDLLSTPKCTTVPAFLPQTFRTVSERCALRWQDARLPSPTAPVLSAWVRSVEAWAQAEFVSCSKHLAPIQTQRSSCQTPRASNVRWTLGPLSHYWTCKIQAGYLKTQLSHSRPYENSAAGLPLGRLLPREHRTLAGPSLCWAGLGPRSGCTLWRCSEPLLSPGEWGISPWTRLTWAGP